MTTCREPFLMHNSCAQDDKRILIYTALTIFDMSASSTLFSDGAFKMATNTVPSVISCAQCGIGLYYVINLCTNNEKARRYLQIYIFEKVLTFTRERNLDTNPSLCMMGFFFIEIWLIDNVVLVSGV